ncbi:murein hydrolase activator EnvC family protein [Candidatus Tisiphia endosymbiont of Nemotelus uliginosus]|uniref:murein hydrolase activator EnvC family protein n=1 Tax=Candidatus Tisiphia endosymbiont of Nemotelus uliginosus TaxID=3077926 RepID=UPI0035C89F13
MKINLAFFSLVPFIISGCATQASAPIEYNYGKSYTNALSEMSLSPKGSHTNAKMLENGQEEIINNQLSPDEISFTPNTGYLKAPNDEQTLAQDDTNTIIMPKLIDSEKLIRHQVQEGETLASIANDYGRTVAELEKLNNISQAYDLQKSQFIKIPVSNELLNKKNTERNLAQSKVSNAILLTASKFIKPVEGKIIRRFGEQTPTGESKGINIAANEGEIVHSIAVGKVAFAGKDKRFGNLVIIKLKQGDLYVAYAHLQDLILKKDDLITQGEIIGHVGHTGEVNSPQLHFAIREGKVAIDPLKYLKY